MYLFLFIILLNTSVTTFSLSIKQANIINLQLRFREPGKIKVKILINNNTFNYLKSFLNIFENIHGAMTQIKTSVTMLSLLIKC